MGIARSTYYRASNGSADDIALVETMQAIKDEFEAYGWHRPGKRPAFWMISATGHC